MSKTDTSKTPVPQAPSKPAEPLEAIVTPATPTELIQALVEALGADSEQATSLEVNLRSGRIRILFADRSLRSYRVAP